MAKDKENKTDIAISVKGLDLFYGTFQALYNIDLQIKEKEVTAFIGPSGCGKSTLLRTFNRMNDRIENCKITGDILVYDKKLEEFDVNKLRKKVGMCFQRPTCFPMSIYDNVAYGARIHGIKKKGALNEKVEKALKDASLWKEVKDKLGKSALSLSGGQQQRLCIARSLAVNPSILLMDEPTSALDPIATLSIEELLKELKKTVTIVIVTHNMEQARRISDKSAFFYLGHLIEYSDTASLFNAPKDKRTQAYVTGQFG